MKALLTVFLILILFAGSVRAATLNGAEVTGSNLIITQVGDNLFKLEFSKSAPPINQAPRTFYLKWSSVEKIKDGIKQKYYKWAKIAKEHNVKLFKEICAVPLYRETNIFAIVSFGYEKDMYPVFGIQVLDLKNVNPDKIEIKDLKLLAAYGFTGDGVQKLYDTFEQARLEYKDKKLAQDKERQKQKAVLNLLK